MKKIISLILLMLFAPGIKSYAVMPVEDFMNMPHNVLTGVNTFNSISEMTKQYKVLIDEYKLMVKNMAAPYFWVFQEVKNFNKNIDKYKEQYKKYSDKAAWEAHFASLLDPDTYATSQCFKFGGCSPEENRKIRENREAMMKNAADTTANFVNRFNELSNEYKTRIGLLEKVEKQAEQADGQLKATGATNEYLHILNSNMTALITKFDSFLEAYNAMNMIEIEKHRKQDAMSNMKEENRLTIKVPNNTQLYWTDIHTGTR